MIKYPVCKVVLLMAIGCFVVSCKTRDVDLRDYRRTRSVPPISLIDLKRLSKDMTIQEVLEEFDGQLGAFPVLRYRRKGSEDIFTFTFKGSLERTVIDKVFLHRKSDNTHHEVWPNRQLE